MKRYWLILLLIVSWTLVCAQTDTSGSSPTKKVKPKKTIRKANKRIKDGNTYDASDLFEQVLKQKPENMKVAYKLAYNYYLERDYKKSEQWFAKVYQTAPEDYPLSGYWLAVTMKMNAKYQEAKLQFNTFIKTYKGSESAKYKKWAKTDAEGCDLAIRLRDNPVKQEVTHLSDSVNSAYTDIAPVLWNDTTLLFAALPVDSAIQLNKMDTTAPAHFLKFYTAIRSGDEYKQAEPFTLFAETDVHTANGAFSVDRRSFYYTICAQDKRNVIRCNIYVSKWQNGAWQPGVKLGPEVNAAGYTNTHPALGLDSKGQEVLYFASDRPDNRGGMDIWYSIRKKDGSFTAAKNAGKINTDRDEATPFVPSGTDTLYYSSQGWPGMGGYDIFYVTGTFGKWTDPVNAGYPLNSQTDDMYYRQTGRSEGYFVSNRPGIISIRSETCCDDIFSFAMPKPKFIAVEGYVLDKNTNEIINGARVSLSSTFQIAVDTTKNDKMYFYDLEFDKDYSLHGSKQGYLPGSATVSTMGLTKSDTLRQDIYLERLVIGKAYRLRNVYYDYDKWFLREESKLTLDTVYDIMMANPQIIVELGSHTDLRATHEYNEYLSQRRAESCMYYLLQRGIPLERLRAKGYGETATLEDCSPYPDCPPAGPGDCPCHQQNRRTEFKIIGVLDGPLHYDDVRFEDLKGKK